VKFRGGKLEHEHIYWDQASVLKQIGLLTDAGLPVFGVETASRLKGLCPAASRAARA
jgi:carboxymethylenebutenolidase